jgi:hypothetical protein
MFEWWGQMPNSADDRSELFAQAVEAGAARRAADDELERDLARDLAVVRMLVHAGPTVGPDDAARQRMRERILAGFDAATDPSATLQVGTQQVGTQEAGTPESQPAETVSLDQRRQARRGRRQHRQTRAARTSKGPGSPKTTSMHGRLLGAAAAALCLLLSLSGMSLVLARDALPGDTLYGVKRSAESAELGLTFGDESRGFKHLQFATARVDEIEALAAKAGASGDNANADPSRYLTALQAFDTDAAAGSRLLIDSATSDTGEQLDALGGWAGQQRQRLADAKPAMPSRAQSRADGSMALLQRVSDRVAALQQRLSCQTVTSQERDDLGRLPANDECVPVTTGPRAPAAPAQQGESTEPSPANLIIPGEGPGVGGTGGTGGTGQAGTPNPLDPLGSLSPLEPALPGSGGTGQSGGEQVRSGQPADATPGAGETLPVPAMLPGLPGAGIGG